MRKKGSVLIYGLMLGLLVIILAMALAPSVAQFTNSARNASSSDYTIYSEIRDWGELSPTLTKGEITLYDGDGGFFLYYFGNNLSSSVVSWWRAEGDANDYTGLNHGEMQLGANATSPGKINSSFGFDGVEDKIVIPNPQMYDLTDGFTVSVWINIHDYNSDGIQSSIVGHEDAGGDTEGWSLNVGTDGKPTLTLNGGDWDSVQSTTILSLNQWYYLVGVFNGSYGWLYINGVLDSEKDVGSLIAPGNQQMRIGYNDVLGQDRYFKGYIDEVVIMNSTISSAQVKEIYDSTNVSGYTQSFTVQDVGGSSFLKLSNISLNGKKIGNPNGIINVYLKESTSGSILSEGTYNTSSLTTTYDNFTINMSEYFFSVNGEYYLFVNCSNINSTNYVSLNTTSVIDSYWDGELYSFGYYNGQEQLLEENSKDLLFKYSLITNGRESSGLDCSNSSISNFDKATCYVVDMNLFYFIGALIFIAGGIITAKFLFDN